MPTTERKMPMALSHCVVVRAVAGSAAGGSTSAAFSAFLRAAASAFLSWLFAMMTSASANFFLCASRACLVLSAMCWIFYFCDGGC